MLPLASLGDDISGFLHSVGQFFSSIGQLNFLSLLVALSCFGIYLSLRSRAFFHVLRAAYPTERIEFRRIWGAYVAAYGFNNVVPARGGDVIKLFLTRTSIPNASYPAVAAAFLVEGGFDLAMGVFILTFAFTQGVFPKPPDFSKLGAFDLSLFASHFRFTLFLLTAIAFGVLAGFAILSRRVKAFWARIRQGLTILGDRPKYFREVFFVQFVGWLFRFTAFWFMLDAFNVGGSVKNVLLVLGVNAVAAVVPFTPGGAGVQQAFLVKVFAGTASGATIAAYSVGQQLAIASFSLALGFVALATIFKFRSFKAVIAAGRESRAAEQAGGTVAATPGAAMDLAFNEQPPDRGARRRSPPPDLFRDEDLDFEPVTRRQPPPAPARGRGRRGRRGR